MKAIKAAHEVMQLPEPTNKMEVLKHLERIGRVCYKSEDKITDESCIKFLQNIRDRKHWAMLEHYIFTFSVPKEIYDDIMDVSRMTPENYDLVNKMPFIHPTYWAEASDEKYKYMISASATALNYLWECECYRGSEDAGLVVLCNWMLEEYPELMREPRTYPEGVIPGRMSNTDIHFVTHKELKTLPKGIRMVHDSMSVKFTVDRGVTHELVRHRPCSWAQESTRYCNYSSGKFGNEITVINPTFFPVVNGVEGTAYRAWQTAMEKAEGFYDMLIKLGSNPQQARTVLPQSTKADIVMTASMFEARHFFNMRADAAAHPQMREVAIPFLIDCIAENPDLFEDLSWRISSSGR